MSRALRYLRIAFSLACLLACGLVVALSIRSYHTIDIAGGPLSASYNYEAISVRGLFKLTAINSSFPAQANHNTISANSREADVVENHVRHYSNNNGFGFYDRHALIMPYWVVAVAIGMLALAPWLTLHFGLRTLLIATTLIALALGAIVLLSRQ